MIKGRISAMPTRDNRYRVTDQYMRSLAAYVYNILAVESSFLDWKYYSYISLNYCS